MSEIEPRQEDLQKPLETPEAATPESNNLESCQSQLLSQEPKVSKDEDSIEQPARIDEVESIDKLIGDSSVQLPTSDDEIGSVDKLTSDYSVQSSHEVSLVNSHDAETSPSSQESPLTLESIYQELKFLGESMQKLQTSVDFLTEEVADFKQHIVPTNIKTTQVNQKRKQSQSSSLNHKKLEPTQSRSKKLDFNTVAFLQEHGEDKLQEELEKKANTELIKIIRLDGMKSGKDVKNIGREDMIKEIILNTKRRLQQGSVFLKD